MNTTPYANSLFEQPWWLDIVAPSQWRESFVKDDKRNIIARFAYAANKKQVFMPKLTQTLGVYMSNEIRQNYGKQKNVLNELFEPLSDYKRVNLALSPKNSYVLPFRWLGYSITPAFTYRLENLSDTEQLYQKFNKTVKRHIKCARNKVKIYEDTNANTLIKTLDLTFEAQNRKNPMPEKLIRKIISVCENNSHGKYFEARDFNGHVHSCAYLVYDRQVCYYLMGGSDKRYRSSGAQSLVLWHSILFASKHSEIFDFEGSMVEGIEHFFRGFSGKCVPYFSIKKQSLLDDFFDAAKPRIKRLIGYKI